MSDAGGNALAVNSYDEYGIPASTNIGRFQYTGQTWLPEVGLYYYKARIYSPTLGRFMQTDPIGYNDSMNIYGYVGNDPVNMIDPSGLNRCTQRQIEEMKRGGATKAEIDNTICIWGGGRDNSDPRGERGPTPSNGGNRGGGGNSGRDSENAQTQLCQSPQESALGSIASIADDFSDATAGFALGSLALAAVTSETIVGGLTFGGLSAGLGGLSALGAGVSAKYFDGNMSGAISTGVGAVVGLFVPLGMEKGMRLATGGERLVAGVTGESYGWMTSSIICSGH